MKYFRQYGASTGAVLEALGKAMQAPGTIIPIVEINSLSNRKRMFEATALRIIAKRVVDKLELENIDLTIYNYTACITSKNYGYMDPGNISYTNVVIPATAEDWDVK